MVAVETGGLLDILAHQNPAKYPRQRILVVAVDNYAHLVPFVEEEEYFFLKTIIPSRKATRDYLQEGEADAEETSLPRSRRLPAPRRSKIGG